MKTLIGKVRKRQVFELPHSIYCEGDECVCKSGTVTVNRTSRKHVNARSFVKLPRLFPKTLVVGYGEKKHVRNAALKCPGIAAAIRRGWLVVR